MDSDEKLKLYEGREYIVAKSNAIVQKSRYELSVVEQRTIAYICSLIKPRTDSDRVNNQPFILEYDFNIRDYARICGLSCDNGRIYEETKTLLKGLQQKVMWMTLEDGTETTVNWVNKVWTNKRSGLAKIRLDEDMTPHLFDLQAKFLSYGLKNILAMKSQYSIRLYEILKSYAFQKSKTFEIDELKRLLMVETVKSYGNYNLFKTKVLDVAQEEINELTDITVFFEPILKGRKTVKVNFKIKQKDTWASGSCAVIADKKLGKIE
jgi:plasmid replication initiation protein